MRVCLTGKWLKNWWGVLQTLKLEKTQRLWVPSCTIWRHTFALNVGAECIFVRMRTRLDSRAKLIAAAALGAASRGAEYRFCWICQLEWNQMLPLLVSRPIAGTARTSLITTLCSVWYVHTKEANIQTGLWAWVSFCNRVTMSTFYKIVWCLIIMRS